VIFSIDSRLTNNRVGYAVNQLDATNREPVELSRNDQFSRDIGQSGRLTFSSGRTGRWAAKLSDKAYRLIVELVRSALSSAMMNSASVKVALIDPAEICTLNGRSVAGTGTARLKDGRAVVDIEINAKYVHGLFNEGSGYSRKHELSLLARLIAHEIWHGRQHAEGYLRRVEMRDFATVPDADFGHSIWHGTLVKEHRHSKMPWEIEAVMAEKRMYVGMLDDLAGQGLIRNEDAPGYIAYGATPPAPRKKSSPMMGM